MPEFLFKRDVIPYGTDSTSRDNQFEITATSDGSYVGRCAELCGTYHSQMNFEVRVVEPDVYAKYVAALASIGPTDPAAPAQGAGRGRHGRLRRRRRTCSTPTAAPRARLDAIAGYCA